MEKSSKATEYLELENKQLYWERDFSKTDIFFRQFTDIVRNFIRSALLLLAVTGLVAFVYHLWWVVKYQLPLLELASWQGKYMLYFWWSVLADIYLVYQLGLDSAKSRWVVRKSFDKIKVRKEKSERVEMSDSFSVEALRLLDKAYLAARRDKKTFNLLYLFNHLLGAKIFDGVFGRLGISVKEIKNILERLIKNLPISKQEMDERIYQVLNQAYEFAYHANRSKVDVTDLLESVVAYEPIIQDVLFDFKITLEQIENVVKWANIQKILKARYQRYRSKAYFKPKGTMDRAMTAVATPVLDSFSEDYTQLARAGYFHLCVAREAEITEIFHIIEGGKNSVVLVGLPGVGKTNIIEDLANRMVAEEVPKILRDKRLVALSTSHLVAGASRPNELEQRILNIINEIIRAGNIILHIDDIHNLVGIASVGTENIDLSEIIAKFILNKSVITIATTTPTDYKMYLESNPLGQILEKVNILEPEDNQAIQMVEAMVGSLESKHRIFFSYYALENAVKLSRRYIPDHYLPDKAYKILEEAAATVLEEKGKDFIVTGEDVVQIISNRTGIPLTEITQEESEKLLNLEERIHQRMVDQKEAVDFVATALRRARTELRDTTKPIANLLFLGPTGVGKTELAKTVAQVYFGAEEKMVRLDMSEYQEQKSMSRLIGSHDLEKGGLLTEAIRKQPFTLLLLDELEKAHPDILNIFLQVMDDGRLTDVMGRTVDFSNCIIIATSNAGTQYIQDGLRAGKTIEEIKNDLMTNELKAYFKPEFLNRFDGIVVFKPLSQEDIEKITVLMLNKAKKRLMVKGIFLEVTPEAVKELAQAGFDPSFGARPLKRVIQERVDNSLANFLLKGKIGRRDKVILDVGGVLKIEKANKF